MPMPMTCADARIETLLALPKSDGWCKAGGKPVRLRSIVAPDRERVVRFACKSWACRVCVCHIRRKYGEHFARSILASDGSLYSARVDPNDWDNKRKALHKRRAEWARVGTLLVWVEPPAEVGDVPHADTEGVIKLIGHELRALVPPQAEKGKRFRPVASSTAWALPTKAKRYEFLGWVTTRDPVAVADLLRALGIQGARVKTRPGSDVTLWDVAFDCPEHLRDAVGTALQE